MLDSTSIATPMQRARGTARVSIGLSGGRNRLRDLAQAGSAKVMLPNVAQKVPEAVFLNTAGGVTGGDQFSFDAETGAGASLVATTQTAERAYASTGDSAQVNVALRAGENASLAWLPQETILFETSRLRRRTRIDLSRGARFLGVETTVLGRAAMGEVLSEFHLDDRREIFVDGKPAWIEALTLTPQDCVPLAGLSGARALTTVMYYGDDAQDRAAQLSLPSGVAASTWDSKLVIRGAFPDLWPLKQALIPILQMLLRSPLPRVWQI